MHFRNLNPKITPTRVFEVLDSTKAVHWRQVVSGKSLTKFAFRMLGWSTSDPIPNPEVKIAKICVSASSNTFITIFVLMHVEIAELFPVPPVEASLKQDT